MIAVRLLSFVVAAPNSTNVSSQEYFSIKRDKLKVEYEGQEEAKDHD
jgi:hypothetical protein